MDMDLVRNMPGFELRPKARIVIMVIIMIMMMEGVDENYLLKNLTQFLKPSHHLGPLGIGTIAKQTALEFIFLG